MPRVIIPPESVTGQGIVIRDRALLHHLQRVLRVQPGEPIECVDAAGHLYRGAITVVEKQEIRVDVQERIVQAPGRQLTLAHALIKPERFEWMAQKATELGVARIVPLVTARTAVRDAQVLAGRARMERWRRIMAAAAAQCGRARVPVLEPPQPVEEILAALPRDTGILLAASEQRVPFAEEIRRLKPSQELTVFIGPEGDFTPEEIAAAAARGVRAVTLGPTVLRSETAALAAIAILQHAWGEWAGQP
jgi:16S rRNA (uracil1498-N3)-methyltransferase